MSLHLSAVYIKAQIVLYFVLFMLILGSLQNVSEMISVTFEN